ncbi:MAG: DUF2191 domain-containing protein [Gammaproteobacteria bacterium]|nr:MAG: DUF2191 domain-containing protein [Gammaproteobacteria bacterium]
MRTNIVIDDTLMNEAIKATGAKTKKEAVELGLKTIVQLKKQEKIKRYRGKLSWEGNLDDMRRD